MRWSFEALHARGVPFVVISGYALDERSAPALVDAPRVGKPFVPEDLRRVLDRLVQTGAARSR